VPPRFPRYFSTYGARSGDLVLHYGAAIDPRVKLGDDVEGKPGMTS
jgi:hypothetical protein